jgi:hypothetical protein
MRQHMGPQEMHEHVLQRAVAALVRVKRGDSEHSEILERELGQQQQQRQCRMARVWSLTAPMPVPEEAECEHYQRDSTANASQVRTHAVR